MTPRIVVLDGAPHEAAPHKTTPHELVAHLRAVRAAGDIPLVIDGRLPHVQREAVHSLVRDARPPAGAAWASLTSGSSGTPRVVLRTAASWEQSFPVVSGLLHDPAVPEAERVVALPAPPSSSLTLFSLAHALGGGPRPVLPGPGPDEGFAQATAFHGTPQALRALLDGGKLPRVRTALVGGSHLDQSLRADAESRGIRVISYYGAAVPVHCPRLPRRRRAAAHRRRLGDGRRSRRARLRDAAAAWSRGRGHHRGVGNRGPRGG